MANSPISREKLELLKRGRETELKGVALQFKRRCDEIGMAIDKINRELKEFENERKNE